MAFMYAYMLICVKRHAPARKSVRAAAPRSPAAVRRSPHTTGAAVAHANGPDQLDTVFASVARYFSLLADPTRLKILHVICQSEQSVSAIVHATGKSQTNVSRHLALLHQAGVVGRRKDGSAVYYQAEDPQLVSICRTVCVQIAGRIDARQPLREELLEFAGRAP